MAAGRDDVQDSESHGLLGRSVNQSHVVRRHKIDTRYFLSLSILINIIFTFLGLLSWLRFQRTTQPSYENGFDSDLSSVKSEIELTQYSYEGGVKLGTDGKFTTNPSTERYVGTPTVEIDRAWGHLMEGLNIDLESPAPELKTFKWPENNLYFTGLEVFHSLHCLNRLRQALYPEYYNVFSNKDDPSREDHIGHCINHLRQAIQCHRDLTPMEWEIIDNKILLKTETLHTCRNFEKIQEWAKERKTDFGSREAVKNGSLFVVD